jgi:hypothetical protein
MKPLEIRWTAIDHYDAGIQALADSDSQLAIAHAVLGILRALDHMAHSLET